MHTWIQFASQRAHFLLRLIAAAHRPPQQADIAVHPRNRPLIAPLHRNTPLIAPLRRNRPPSRNEPLIALRQ